MFPLKLFKLTALKLKGKMGLSASDPDRNTQGDFRIKMKRKTSVHVGMHRTRVQSHSRNRVLENEMFQRPHRYMVTVRSTIATRWSLASD